MRKGLDLYKATNTSNNSTHLHRKLSVALVYQFNGGKCSAVVLPSSFDSIPGTWQPPKLASSVFFVCLFFCSFVFGKNRVFLQPWVLCETLHGSSALLYKTTLLSVIHCQIKVKTSRSYQVHLPACWLCCGYSSAPWYWMYQLNKSCGGTKVRMAFKTQCFKNFIHAKAHSII